MDNVCGVTNKERERPSLDEITTRCKHFMQTINQWTPITVRKLVNTKYELISLECSAAAATIIIATLSSSVLSLLTKSEVDSTTT